MNHIDRIDLATPVQDIPPLIESYDDPAVAEVRVVEGDEMFTSQDYTELTHGTYSSLRFSLIAD